MKIFSSVIVLARAIAISPAWTGAPNLDETSIAADGQRVPAIYDPSRTSYFAEAFVVPPPAREQARMQGGGA